MSDEYRIIKLASGFAAVHGHTLIDVSRAGTVYKTQRAAQEALERYLMRQKGSE